MFSERLLSRLCETHNDTREILSVKPLQFLNAPVMLITTVATLACAPSMSRRTTPVDTLSLPRNENRAAALEGTEYYVELKPEVDQVRYAPIVAARVGGRLGYVSQNVHSFTILSVSDSAVDAIRRMPEVFRVTRAPRNYVDARIATTQANSPSAKSVLGRSLGGLIIGALAGGAIGYAAANGDSKGCQHDCTAGPALGAAFGAAFGGAMGFVVGFLTAVHGSP
jgi:hypothetical protein